MHLSHRLAKSTGIVVTVAAVTVAVVIGALAAYLGELRLPLAIAVCLLPLVPVLILRTELAAILAVACLPFQTSIVGGALGGLNVAPTDLLYGIVLIGFALKLRQWSAIRQQLNVLRPVRPYLVIYFAAMLVVSAVHPSFQGLIAIVQRAEVIGLSMVVGALVLTERGARSAWRLMIGGCLLIALLWIFNNGDPGVITGQKNPSAQFMADAALVALVVVRNRLLSYGLLALLVVGIYAAESRGALLGLGAGVLIWTFLHARDPIHYLIRLVPFALLVVGVYASLPHSEQQRMLGQTEATEFNDSVRTIYAQDARHIIHNHRIFGVGVGNYLAGDPAKLTLTDDPHNVILLETAEGGLVLITAFAVLQAGTLVVVFRRRRESPWAATAIAVQVAILVHSAVDVYWVRGTPAPGWILVGLALAAHSTVGGRPTDGRSAGGRAVDGRSVGGRAASVVKPTRFVKPAQVAGPTRLAPPQ